MRQAAPARRAPRRRRGAADTFWALEGLRERTLLDGSGMVLFTGLVELPTGEHYEWLVGPARR